MGRPFRRLLAVLAVAVALPASVATRERTVEVGDAYVEHDVEARRWRVGNATIELSIVLGIRGELTFGGLGWPQGRTLTTSTDPDGLVTLDDETAGLGSREGPFRVESVSSQSGPNHVELLVRLHQDRGPLIATRHYRTFPNTPVVEVWTSFDSESGDPTSLRNLNALEMTVSPGRIHWVTGLDASSDQGGPFTRRAADLQGVGDRIEIGSGVLASSQNVPFAAIEGEDATFFVAMAWSGGWSANLERLGAGIRATVGLPPMSASVSASTPVEGPHALVGVMPGGVEGASMALVRAALARRDGRQFSALSTYNTWFIYGIRISEGLIRQAIDQTSRVGVELFQLDAGWYPPDGRPSSPFDFTSGLGSWAVDQERFPNGLGTLGDYARSRGQKFGVWVEPERVALSTVGRQGLAEERFLATTDGAYQAGVANDEATDAQICLSDRGARQWVLAQLTAFIDAVRPDYLKWDSNRWVVCNRPGHGHPTDGGNFAHVQGLYEILRELRARYPALLIENCSGGGRRLDFAMTSLTDAGWMDDRTTPAEHVRHNLEGLSTVFPSSYLLSYVMPHEQEPMAGSVDMPLLMRSRMPGVLGVSVDFDTLDPLDRELIYQDLVVSSVVKGIQAHAATYLLTPQAGSQPDWEVLQQQSFSSGRSVLFAFDRGRSSRVSVRLRGLDRDTVYQLASFDRGRLGAASGAALMDEGLDIRSAPESSAQVITVDPVGSAEPTPRPGIRRVRR
jgi:alpha-galactosidase